MKQPLSPAAAAAWEAFNEVAERVGVLEDYGDALAAALRALAYQVAQPPFNTQSESDVRALLILHQIKAIAAELES